MQRDPGSGAPDRCPGRRIFGAAGTVAEFALVAMLVVMVAEVVARQIFHSSLLIAEELASYFLLAATFLGLGLAFFDGALFRMEAIIERVRGAPRQTYELVLGLLALAVSAILTWWLTDYTLSTFDRGLVSDGRVPIPLWIPQVTMPLGALLLTLACLLHLLSVIRGGRS